MVKIVKLHYQNDGFFFNTMFNLLPDSYRDWHLKIKTIEFSVVYFNFSLILCGIASLFQVLVLQLHYQGDTTMPAWVAKYFLFPLATITLTKIPGHSFCCAQKQVRLERKKLKTSSGQWKWDKSIKEWEFEKSINIAMWIKRPGEGIKESGICGL